MLRLHHLFLAAAVAAAASHSFAQSSLPAAKPAGQTGGSVKPGIAPPTSTTAPVGDIVGYRLPLLREGSVISRVVGDITLDPDEKHWVFRPVQPESGNLRREFVLLPSLTLEDMLQTRRLAPSPVEFELTGRVFIYKGRNYLLAELAPPIVRFDTRPDDAPTQTSRIETSPNGASKFAPPDPNARNAPAPKTGNANNGNINNGNIKNGESQPVDRDGDATVEDIERRLEKRIGRTPLGRTSTSAARPDDDADRPRGSVEETDTPLPEPGSRLVLRAGRLMRDPQAGSWRFVPEQTTGKGDRSLEILPCLMLERLERMAREGESSPKILLSGTVIVFEGNAYLLPTNFRKSREGRGLGR
jgi:hypothetical protein